MHELVVDAPRHVGQREFALLGAERGVEDDLEQQVAELLLEMGRVAATSMASTHLVGLLDAGAGRATRGSAHGPTGTARADVRTSSAKRISSLPTGAASVGIHSE